MAKFSFGTDPEFMLTKDGKYFSAIGIVPGTKEKRYKVGKNSYYYDNVLAECTVEPAFDRDDAIAKIGNSLKTYAKLVAPYRINAQASQNYPAAELKHEDALLIGCTPEVCAYTIAEVIPPSDIIANTPLRSAGGHIHIGSPFPQDELNCIQTIRMLDLFVGVPSVLLDVDKTSKKRREIYGNAGRFRKPEHGAEYRSIGNFWLASPKLVGLIHDLCNFTMDFVEAGRHEDLWQIDMDKLQDDDSWNTPGFHPSQCHHCVGYDLKTLRAAIDTSDRKKAQKMLDYVGSLMPAKLFAKLTQAVNEAGPVDLYKEWKINV